MRHLLSIIMAIVPLAASGCAHLPSLGSVLERVDVDRVLQCAAMADPADRAACLGLEAVDKAVDLALSQCDSLAKEAKADDPARPDLASDLDQALDELGSSIANAKENAGPSSR